MSFDGIFTHTMISELKPELISGRISKIQQPFAQELLLTIRAHGNNHTLLLSANNNYARVQITKVKFESPITPSNFVMSLRKHLAGAILKDIEQITNDRIIVFKFQNHDELGDLQTLSLYAEIMNRHSNIILVRERDQKIIDSIKHINNSQDRFRELLPGAIYKLPPQLDLLNPFDSFAREKFVKAHIKTLINGSFTDISSLIKQTFMGLGKESLLEVVERLQTAKKNETAILKSFNSMFEQLKQNPQATIYTKSHQQVFTPIPYQTLQESFQEQAFSSLSLMLDDYYQDRARKDRVRQQANNLLQIIKRNLKRNNTKLKKLNKDLQKTKSADQARIAGELLTTFMNKVPRGVTKVSLPNYYDENNSLEIKLQPDLSPSKNAQRYFKTYQKLKKSVKHLHQQIDNTTEEINYLNGILSQLEYAKPQDIADIDTELRQEGYLKNNLNKKNRSRKKHYGDIFIATDGTKIHVGKNNLQNDYLTTKFADKRFTWLHIKNMPGSHVIIESLDPSNQTIKEAAQLAAYYSKAGQQSDAKVPIDYTLVKHVHKPNGSKPGYVIYTDQNTIYVEPHHDLKYKD